jgi:two-component system sensor histidine kinase ChiS
MIGKGALASILALSLFLVSIAEVGANAGKAHDVVYRVGSGAVLLSGPWERIEGLVTESLSSGHASRSVDFPLRSVFPLNVSPGPATYRMSVWIERNGAPPARMALYVPAVNGLLAAYVNGKALYDRDRDPAAPPLLLFDAPGDEAVVVFQIGAGGRGLEEATFLPSFTLFGDARSVSRTSILLGALAAFQDGFFLLVGLFVIVLFLFWKKNLDFHAFALYMFATALLFFLKDAVLFLYSPLDASQIRLETVFVVATDIQYSALAYLVRTMYHERVRAWIAAAFYTLPVVHAAAVMAFPSAFIPLAAAGSAYYVLFHVSALGFSAYLAANGDKRARWLTPAFAVAVAGLALKYLGPESIWAAYLIESAGLMVFGIIVMLMLVRKVAVTFESADALSVYVAKVSKAVETFIPKEFLEHLDKTDFIDLRLGDHTKKKMTIFFSDIRGFTSLSEKLTVEENFAFINSYLARVVPIIKANGGFVDKYIGDAIMALFPGPNGPDEAIRSAIAMQTKMVEYNGHRAKMGYRPISMGVGVHTGDLMLGVVGVVDRMENTVISDAVNLSSRLQAITKAFNIGLAISEQAFKELEDPGSYKYRFIGKVKVKGKAAPVSVFEIFDGITPDLFERKMKANMFFEQGMLSYYQKDFAGAMYYFKRVLETIPEDGAAGFYLDNCMNKASL